MAKRTVTRVGDVFCVEFDGEYKRYFHYVAKDEEQFGCPVIQIFRRRYPIAYEADVEEIVNDEVTLHIHTVIQAGTAKGFWYKIGNSKNINHEALRKVVFGCVHPLKFDAIKEKPGLALFEVNPTENWRIWKFNIPIMDGVKLPHELFHKIVPGPIYPPPFVVELMRYGYFRISGPMYQASQREPWDYIHSYLKSGNNDDLHYYHFLGPDLMREIVVSAKKETIRLSREYPIEKEIKLSSVKFEDILNCDCDNYITEEEFNSLWEG